MFTGIVSRTTKVKGTQQTTEGLLLSFEKPAGWHDLRIGESISTDGVCLTVAAIHKAEYDCLLMPETLDKTTFGQVVPSKVNLERSLSASDRFGGHFVLGHVDTVSKVIEIKEGDGWRLRIALPPKTNNLIINKGSIAINGISLTVTTVNDDSFEVALIPHTLKHTTLGLLKAGDDVNLEFDMIGKYVVGTLGHEKAKQANFQPFDASQWRIGMVVSQFNQHITRKLHESALKRASAYSIPSANIDTVMVAGAIEIPLILQHLAKQNHYRALLAIGCVIKGDTPHFDYVCKLVADGVLRVQLDFHIPIAFGVLTCDDEAQAMVRTHLGSDYLDAVLHQARLLS